jgi:hypothetical protein
MKRIISMGALVVMLTLSLQSLGQAQTPANFSGEWTLNKEQSKGLSGPLKNARSYTMSVTQDENQLRVENNISGANQDNNRQGGQQGGNPNGGMGGGRRGGGYPGRNGGIFGIPGIGLPGGGGYPSGGGGAPGGGPSGGGGYPSGGQSRGRTDGGGAATPPRTAVYSLDGKETQTESEGRFAGTTTLKAAWKNEGSALELTSVRQVNRRGSQQGGDVTITIRETWELADEGKGLKVQRSVSSPRGSEDSTLYFTKQ